MHDESEFYEKPTPRDSSSDKLLRYMVECGIDECEMTSWPSGVLLPIQEHLSRCSAKPSLSLPTAALTLLGEECSRMSISCRFVASCRFFDLSRVKARLQPFTVFFSFTAIFVCFIDAQIHSFFLENMSGFERQ